MVYEREVYMAATKLQLCSLATVYHKLFVANLYYLRTGIMACGRQCRPAPQYVYFKLFHRCLVLWQGLCCSVVMPAAKSVWLRCILAQKELSMVSFWCMP